jgi:hypothetical protein
MALLAPGSAALLALFLALFLATPPAPSPLNVCFVRAEDTGLMNLVPAHIIGWHADRRRRLASVRGGERRCLELEEGSWSFRAWAPWPYPSAPSEGTVCRSNVVRIEVRRPGITSIAVSPRAGSTYVCSWTLRRR